VSTQSPKRRVTVCLVSFHPLLASEFQRILSSDEFRLLFRRADAVIEESGLPVPRASVYALEAHRQNEVTERLAGAIAGKNPTARLLVISERFDESNAFPLLRLGAKGLLRYSDVATQLARALGVISESGFWVPRSLLSQFVNATLNATRRRPWSLPITRRLSRREQEVLQLLLRNLSNKEIAQELHISARTAKFHVSNLLAKHGVRRRADLILIAVAQSDA
jgi:DNA-binding NarL/FixJ family response regulator